MVGAGEEMESRVGSGREVTIGTGEGSGRVEEDLKRRCWRGTDGRERVRCL